MTARWAVMFGVAIGTLSAGTNQWTSLGPEGGSIGNLVANPHRPGTIYGTSTSESFRSANGGAQWSVTNFPLGLVVPDPRDDSTLYVITWGRGIFKSTDAGASWKGVNSGLPDHGFVYSLAIPSSGPAILYSSVGWNRPTGSTADIFISTDGGENWTASHSGIPENHCCGFQLALDPRDPGTLYAAELDGVGGLNPGLYKSTDAGISWRLVQDFNSAGQIQINPRQPEIMYAAACQGHGSDEDCDWTVIKSGDGGETWFEANGGLPLGVGLVKMDPQNPDTLYASAGWVASSVGLYKTTDGGTNWTFLAKMRVSGLAFDPQSAGTLYASTPGGVLKSTDGGANWSPLSGGLTATYIQALAIDPNDTSTVYAAEGGSRVVKSGDRGASWSPTSAGLPESAVLRSLTIDPRNTATIWAVAAAQSFPGRGAIFKSVDGGLNWVNVDSALPPSPYALALDPSNPATAYVSTAYGFYKTTDGAKSWQLLGPGPTAGDRFSLPAEILLVDPQNPQTIYARAIMTTSQIWKSTDGGVSFHPSNAGLPSLGSLTATVVALAMDTRNPATLYAWLPDFNRADVHGGLYKSVDAGNSWEPVAPGLPAGANVNELVVDPRNSGTLLVATYSGVFRSTDGGQHWSELNAGLTAPLVNTLAVDPQNTSTLYAGTAGGGVFGITLVGPEN